METGILKIITAYALKTKSFNSSACEIQILSKPVVLSTVVVLLHFQVEHVFWGVSISHPLGFVVLCRHVCSAVSRDLTDTESTILSF